ncbi:MAG: glycosyltransferase family 4 protein [Prevotella sp.]|nr:glycosyltransferase family 4 protein [Prevotella sp.]
MVKINILSPGRFHVCDLARELDHCGFDVKYYSFVLPKRTEKYGLSKRCCCSLFYWLFPFLYLERCLFKKKIWANILRKNVQDFVTALLMRRCDVLIAMSGGFLRSINKAKSQGSLIIVERGSKHILEQKRILDELKMIHPQINTVHDINVRRELEGYEIADYVAIPSQHVRRSFAVHHYPMKKLFLNPYGVDVSMFHPSREVEKKYDLIMVGGWSLQKGCDLIIDAVRITGLCLLHVGALVDLDFPNEENFTHINPVDQSELVKYYNMAKIFILPSRQEGLAMVQVQAIACNLPIIGSPNSGALDLKRMVESPEYIIIIEDWNVSSVVSAINHALALKTIQNEKQYAGNAIYNLTWEAYGKRYAEFLRSIISE